MRWGKMVANMMEKVSLDGEEENGGKRGKW
jgi:hypothetical protein